MKAHRREGRSKEPREEQRTSREHQNSAATRILALQRAAGNAAVTDMLADRPTVQRVETPGRPRGAVAREQAMSATYGIRIGPGPGGGAHFTNAMLDQIDAALRELPLSDLRDNEHLLAIEMDDNQDGSTSEYREDQQTVAIVRPVLAGGVRAPQWLYARLNRSSAWQRGQMDRGALSGYEGVSRGGDRALGIGRGERHVMGGTSDALAHGNLVEWTVRHEVGHSVDLMVAWERDLAGEERFGGWRTYDNGLDLDEVAEAVLTRAGLHTVNPAGHRQAVTTLSGLLRPRSARENAAGNESRLHRFLARYQPHLDAAAHAERSALVLRFVRLALAQPWTLDDGGAPILDVDGRTFHVDHYDTWVSYSTAQRRQHALSNYQFSTPREWFAEAYAAYYDPAEGVRDRLSAEVRAWFATIPRQRPADQE
ncbi:hypothetical protein [Actinokineospora iranica]|uniref:Uncharacterized protein n=1 Tax=Actinokineospora iranica TaxID=1271860 RepID=A0A1G6J373_9PSEU|nr:hypothetical protein [Actinokineospora iranica]SDC13087.1 hypothetical protein SAMN05216174_101212 [Actinokineospora iranica]